MLTMKKRPTDTSALQSGELYLFHPTDRFCPAAGSLWGVFNRHRGEDGICLETCSRDLFSFKKWHCVPAAHYRFFRLAARTELRDYYYNLAVWECALSSGK